MPARDLGRVGVFSHGIRGIPGLKAFLGASEIVYRPDLRGGSVDAVVGWGRKANTLAAYRYALQEGRPYYFLEDGFVRSVRPGSMGDPPLSMVVDDLGIYYDATRPSRLESLLETNPEGVLDDPALLERARAAMGHIVEAGLSKYNHAPDLELPPTDRQRVLVVDQTLGDLSIRMASPSPDVFDRMLRAALDENPEAEVLVKTHPETIGKVKRGHYAGASLIDERVRLISQPASTTSIVGSVDSAYVVSSLLGFEALVAGREVVCFGKPFYSGWGLTDDRCDNPRRTRRRSVEQVFAAAYILYSRYVDPETLERCELERVLEHLALQRRLARENAGHILCVGMSRWKRAFIPAYLRSPHNRISFVRNARGAAKRRPGPDAPLAVWGVSEGREVRELAERTGAPLWRIEDGFLRSVGLGSDLHLPSSLVVDRRGIYYDPAGPSDLEVILEEAGFSEAELARAARLRRVIVDSGISKYNVGSTETVGPGRDDRRVVLVVGQVEDDASVRRGCPGIHTNGELVQAAREACPEAFLIFKPHPDVVSGNRRGEVEEAVLAKSCDQVVRRAPLADCLAVADEVHTLTSLVGFEALLRSLDVVVYGQPFYAGWGLTTDVHPHPRRNRRLSLDQLVAGALIRYPRYVSRSTGVFTTPERIVDELRRARDDRGRSSLTSTWPTRQARKLSNLIRGMKRAP